MEVEKNIKIVHPGENRPTYKIAYENSNHGGLCANPKLIEALKEAFCAKIEPYIKKGFRDEGDFIQLPDGIPRHDPELIEIMEEYVRLETELNSKLEFCAGWSYRIIETDSKYYKIIDGDYNEEVILADDMVQAPY